VASAAVQPARGPGRPPPSRSRCTPLLHAARRERVRMAAGVPVKPMLARICEGPGDALRLLGPGAFLAEHKYDGQRAQVGRRRRPAFFTGVR
jgi:ATP-dependent DNA ligase